MEAIWLFAGRTGEARPARTAWCTDDESHECHVNEINSGDVDSGHVI